MSPRPVFPRPPAGALLLGLALVLAACTSAPPQRPVVPPASPPPRAAAHKPPPATPPPPPTDAAPASLPAPVAGARTAGAEGLAVEQRWLQDWFRGTPVRIALRGDGLLAVEVPLEFSFDAGRAQVKPALGAVLDKVAESLRRRPGTRLQLLAAPADAAGGGATSALALQRAAGVQRYLRDRGVAAARLAEPVAEGSAAVQLRIAVAAP